MQQTMNSNDKKQLLLAEKIIDSLFANSDCADPTDKKKDKNHSLKTREWILKLKEDASVSLQIAALAHDIDRTNEKRKAKKYDFTNYEEYKKQHAIASANIICEELKSAGFDSDI